MVATIVAVVLSYVLGSVPTGLWLGLKFRGIDIREPHRDIRPRVRLYQQGIAVQRLNRGPGKIGIQRRAPGRAAEMGG